LIRFRFWLWRKKKKMIFQRKVKIPLRKKRKMISLRSMGNRSILMPKLIFLSRVRQNNQIELSTKQIKCNVTLMEA
jgi:hypothetical protein